jgi:hypothetical protein
MTEKVLDMIKDFPVEVKIVIENRRAARIALRKKQIILRIPKGMNVQQRNKATQELLEWAKNTIEGKQLYVHTQSEHFITGNSIHVLGQEYEIERHFIPGNHTKIHISRPQKKIKISLPIHLSDDVEEMHEWSQKVLIKGFNQYFLADIQKQVHDLNHQYFQAEIGKISLRHTSSRWGSCSSSGSISLSTKLLLVPTKVCEYVIIHELAHRFEMNHSDKFWAHVEKAMPDYKKHLKWLKTEGSKLPI